jgi:ribonuclease-3
MSSRAKQKTLEATASTEPSSDLGLLQERIGYQFEDISLLGRALAHNSWAVESDAVNNQTLEFLGDAVVDLAVSEMLMHVHCERSEGEMTRMRASIVNSRGLASCAEELELGRWVRLGKGEERSGGRQKSRILADTYEAILGAVFLDGGYGPALAMVRVQLGPRVIEAEASGHDFKTEVQELSQKICGKTPCYHVVEVTGPDHERHYRVELHVADELVASGEGPNRKAAEQMAAKQATESLQHRVDTQNGNSQTNTDSDTDTEQGEQQQAAMSATVNKDND